MNNKHCALDLFTSKPIFILFFFVSGSAPSPVGGAPGSASMQGGYPGSAPPQQGYQGSTPPGKVL